MRINEITEKILEEDPGIIKEVEEHTDKLYNMVLEHANKFVWNDKKPYRKMTFDVDYYSGKEWLTYIRVLRVEIIDLISHENYIKNSSYFSEWYDKSTFIVYLKLPFFENKLYTYLSKQMIRNVLMNCYKNYISYLNTERRYSILSKMLMNKYKGKNAAYWLSYCTYYLSNESKVSNHNALIDYLSERKPKSVDILHRSRIYHKKEKVREKIDELSKINEKRFETVLKALDNTKEELFKNLHKRLSDLDEFWEEKYQRYVDGLPLYERYITKEPIFIHSYDNDGNVEIIEIPPLEDDWIIKEYYFPNEIMIR